MSGCSRNDADRFERASSAAGQICCDLGFICRFRSRSEKLSEGWKHRFSGTYSSLLAMWIYNENGSIWGHSDNPESIYSIAFVAEHTVPLPHPSS